MLRPLDEKFKYSKTYFAGVDNSKSFDFDMFYDEYLDTDLIIGTGTNVNKNSSDSLSVHKTLKKAIEYNLFNGWTVTFRTHVKYFVNYDNKGVDDSLRVGDFIELNTWFHTNGLPLRGYIKAITPSIYQGEVSITMFSPVPPDVFTQFYDAFWDGGVLNEDSYNKEDYTFGRIFTYPFKDSVDIGTFGDSGVILDPSYDPQEYQFEDDTNADAEDLNPPQV